MKIYNKASVKIAVNIIFLIMLIITSACNGKKDNKKEVSIATSQVSLVDSIMKPMDSFINQKMDASGIVGLGAAVFVNKELVWIKGFGYADKDKQIPFTPNTVMSIASISKTFTGALLMKAVEDGLVSLDEDINTYLPFKIVNPYFPNEKITLRQLATHTSSLADDYDVYDKTYRYGDEIPEDLGSFLKNYYMPNGKHYSKKNFLNNKPGTYRDYSNIATGLVGYIIETKTGKSLSQYGKNKIFNPLEMNSTGWSLSDINLANHSIQYEKEKDSIKIIPFYSLTTYPDGGVRTSVSDLSKFFIALLNEGKYNETRILKQETAKEMLEFQFTETNKPENINLKEPNKNSGIFWATKRDVTLIGHGGSDFGVSTDMFCDLKKEVGVIVFSNTGEASTYHIYNELWKYGELIKESQK
jgi:CubicO group peptidase (beta-lactamase class C family)